MKWIDLPPVWLLACLVVTWWLGQVQPFALSLAHPVAQFAGGVLVGGGLILMILAAVQMRRQQTTIIPHMEAHALVTTGVFAHSRNPIYLGDALVLTGLALRWDAPLALILVPVFIWIIERRFIVPEEDRLRRKFRADFARYCEKTRRWV
jgi:protein-S-isoprenylcysteine O-methyltransferase Ste14